MLLSQAVNVGERSSLLLSGRPGEGEGSDFSSAL